MDLKSTHLDEIEIRAVIDELSNAIRDKDIEGVVSLYTEKNSLFSLAPPLVDSEEHSDGKAGLRDWFASFHGAIGLESKGLVVTSAQEIAYVYGLRHLTGMKSDGESVDVWYRETWGFCKIAGEWKIQHQHQSVPFSGPLSS